MRYDTEKILKMMRMAGCDTLSFGLQTAHPVILRNINRHPAEPNQLKKIIRIANKFGFVTAVSYIFGLPGDTKDTIQTTIDYSLNCGSTLANYYTLSILSGSDIAIEYKDKKISKIRVPLTEPAYLTLKIENSNKEVVWDRFKNEKCNRFENIIPWERVDNEGKPVPPGIYTLTVEARATYSSKKYFSIQTIKSIEIK